MNKGIRLLRVHHDISQSNMAEKLGISNSYLSEIEHGKKQISIELLRKYANTFNISATSVLFFVDCIDKKKYELNLGDVIDKKLYYLFLWLRQYVPKSDEPIDDKTEEQKVTEE